MATASFSRSGATPISGRSARSATASAGARTVVSCGVLSTAPKPAPSRISWTYSSSPSAKGPTGLLPGRGRGGPASNGRSAAPTCQGFSSTPRQQANTKRPPGAMARRIAAKAAVGSSKNITPNCEAARSNAASSKASVWTSSWTKRAVATPASAARCRASSTSPADRSTPTASPPGATAPSQRDGQAAAAAADVADPLTRARVDRLHEIRRDGLGQALALRPCRHPPLVVPTLGLRLVGHDDTVTPVTVASAPCASAS